MECYVITAHERGFVPCYGIKQCTSNRAAVCGDVTISFTIMKDKGKASRLHVSLSERQKVVDVRDWKVGV